MEVRIDSRKPQIQDQMAQDFEAQNSKYVQIKPSQKTAENPASFCYQDIEESKEKDFNPLVLKLESGDVSNIKGCVGPRSAH
jgi:hypothetical protein